MQRLANVLQRVAFLFALLILWEVAARFGPWPRSLFPSPGDVVESLSRLARNGSLAAAALRSLTRLLEGYLVSVAVGVPLGMLNARFHFLQIAVKPLLMGLQALPSICWLPLSSLWFGPSEGAIAFVVVMGSVLSIAISTEDGVNQIDPQLIRQANSIGVRGLRFYTGVLLPGALPGIVSGLKLGWTFAWRALMAGELLFVSGGLGQLLQKGRELLDVAQVVAVMVTIVAIGVAVDRVVFQPVELKLRRRWGLVAPAR
ncbi:MAG: ABC transporter permease [Myxococcales bacterium]